jgi:fumarylpyruvate hydrolase
MTEYCFPPPPQVAVAVASTQASFPVRRIYCVGRNYAAHIREMGGDERDPPFFFQKPADAIVPDGAQVPYPPFTKDLQYEVELVLAIGKGGCDIDLADAADHVFGLAVGIDLTRRDVQVAARKAGRPWEVGKAFDHSAPIGTIHPLGSAPLPRTGAISLSVNGDVKQSGDLVQLIWNCAEIISQLSAQHRLEPGDLIYTGTPAGVGPVVPGDMIEGMVENLDRIAITVVQPDRAQTEQRDGESP